jgi:hypothetical protein
MVSGVQQLRAALDTIADERPEGPLGQTVLALLRERDRLDAQIHRLVGQFDRRSEYVVDGQRNCGSWLAVHGRMRRDHAHALVRGAHFVAEHEQVRSLFEHGTISAAHVRVITKTMHDAKAEDEIGEFVPALCEALPYLTPDDTAKVLHVWQERLDDVREAAGTLAAKQFERRRLDMGETLGVGVIEILLDALGYEIAQSALHAMVEANRTEADPRTPTQQRADAFVELCRRELARNGTTIGGARSELVVTVPIERLRGSTAEQTHTGEWLLQALERCEKCAAETGRLYDSSTIGDQLVNEIGGARGAHGTAIPVISLRQLCCDAALSILLHGTCGEPLALHRSRRTFTRAQRNALAARDGHCSFPGCRQPPGRCEAHHLETWADGGATNIDNATLVCWTHHRLIHTALWTPQRDPRTKTVVWHRPDGTPHTTNAPPHRRT